MRNGQYALCNLVCRQCRIKFVGEARRKFCSRSCAGRSNFADRREELLSYLEIGHVWTRAKRKARSRCSRELWSTESYREKQRTCRHARIVPNLQPTPELAYILGTLKGDGYVGLGSRKWAPGMVVLKVKPVTFAQSFADAIRTVGLHPHINVVGNGVEGRTYFQTRAYSTAFARWYLALTTDGLRAIATSYPIEFLRGFYEAEGSCPKHGGLNLNNTNLTLITLCEDLCRLLGFSSKIACYAQGRYRPIYRLWIGRRAGGDQLLRIIQPCIKKGVG